MRASDLYDLGMVAHLALVLSTEEVAAVARGGPVVRRTFPVRACGDRVALAGPDLVVFAEARLRCEAIRGDVAWHLFELTPASGRALRGRGQLAAVETTTERPAPMW